MNDTSLATLKILVSGVLKGIVTSRDIDFLEGTGNDMKLSEVNTVIFA